MSADSKLPEIPVGLFSYSSVDGEEGGERSVCEMEMARC